ncbi:YT521-B-like domain [Ancistrocladus abbreviatus]
MYAVSDHGNAETYLMQGTEVNPHLSTMLFDHTETMSGDGAPEFVVDPGMYYPTATNYAYYCTGNESPGEWDDHQRIFGLDGGDIQYAGAQTESYPYVYFTPSYGYGESPYNPYNPFIPGAVIGVDGSYVATQPYYTVPPYQNSVSSPGYFPIVVQSRPDVVGSSSTDPLLDTGTSAASRAVSSGARQLLSSTSAAFTQNSQKLASNLTHSLARTADGSRVNSGSSKRPMTHRSSASSGLHHGASSVVPQGANGSISHIGKDSISHGKVLPQQSQLKLSLPVGGVLADFSSSANGRAVGDGSWSKFYNRRASSDANGNPDMLGEQNRGPRTSRSKNEFVVKAYTTKAGEANSQGNIIISPDQYNRDDLPADYANGKFFVIKSYSEDDVHKSIKYNVWSSTPNGNKKLNSAYEDAQQIASGRSGGCPIFLFFSVNASGQFCGVAEMVGAVDFHKDMDFWQQDKWSGSFPVKWHIIKDVPNTNFRHIILENNEHKPVTNSRDTQEIPYSQGIEMLKIFKNYISKTSLLDDFMYYEHRQKIMQEERARLFPKASALPFEPSGKIFCLVDLPMKEGEEMARILSGSEKTESVSEKVSLNDANDKSSSTISKQNGVEVNDDVGVSMLKIGSLTINPKKTELKYSHATPSSLKASAPVDIVTVGSMPVKVNGFDRSSALLTVGTIPLDPKALQQKTAGASPK